MTDICNMSLVRRTQFSHKGAANVGMQVLTQVFTDKLTIISLFLFQFYLTKLYCHHIGDLKAPIK